MDTLNTITKKIRRLEVTPKVEIIPTEIADEKTNSTYVEEVKLNNSSTNIVVYSSSIEERNLLRDQDLLEPSKRWYIIYVITNSVDGKNYVGQAVSHIKIKEKYKPYAAYGRLLAHFREATSKKKHQCAYLNNAIRAHGKDKFTVETLVECEKKEVDALEVKYIKQYNSMFPNGYNIMKGGRSLEGTEEANSNEGVPRKSPCLQHKLEMAERTRNYNRKKKMHACLEYFIDKTLEDFDSYIVFGKDKDKYECYMLSFKEGSSPLRAIFGGQHTKIEDSYTYCVEFYEELKDNLDLAKHLDAGNTSESESTTCEE